MPKMSKEQLERHLSQGAHVAVGGQTLKPGRTPGDNRAALAAHFPAGTRDVEASVVRDASGALTRAGMEAVIKGGGSVLHKGEIIASLEALPGEDVLAAHDAARLEAHLDDLDRQARELAHQRQKAERALQGARGQPAATTPAGELPDDEAALEARRQELERQRDALKAEWDRTRERLEQVRARGQQSPPEQSPPEAQPVPPQDQPEHMTAGQELVRDLEQPQEPRPPEEHEQERPRGRRR